jgi:hypothetical protein
LFVVVDAAGSCERHNIVCKKMLNPSFENLRNITKWSARFWILVLVVLVVLVVVVVVVDDVGAAAGSADLPVSLVINPLPGIPVLLQGFPLWDG